MSRAFWPGRIARVADESRFAFYSSPGRSDFGGEEASRRGRVLGFGGAALEMEADEELPANIFAILHAPILPSVRVNLKQVWSQRYRVGYTFIS